MRRLFALGLTLAACAAAGPNATSAPPLPASCDAIEAEYTHLVSETPCATVADCTDVRTGSLVCFQGPVKTNGASTEGDRVRRLEAAFHAQQCSAAPCTPAGGTPITTCTASKCETELRP